MHSYVATVNPYTAEIKPPTFYFMLIEESMLFAFIDLLNHPGGPHNYFTKDIIAADW